RTDDNSDHSSRGHRDAGGLHRSSPARPDRRAGHTLEADRHRWTLCAPCPLAGTGRRIGGHVSALPVIGQPLVQQGRSNLNTEEITDRVRDWYLLMRILRLLAPYWVAVSASLGCSLASTVLQILNPLILSVAIDVYLLDRPLAAGTFAALLPAHAAAGITLL